MNTGARRFAEKQKPPQRPKKKAIQQDDVAVRRWLETDYPAIAERAKKEKATIFWEDETAVEQDTN